MATGSELPTNDLNFASLRTTLRSMVVEQPERPQGPRLRSQSAATPERAPTPETGLNSSERISPNRAIAFSCAGCESRWTGSGRAHCAAAGCHRTFSTAGKFDLHRTARGERGTCLDPANVTNASGEHLLVFRDGLWRGPELTDDAKARAGWTS